MTKVFLAIAVIIILIPGIIGCTSSQAPAPSPARKPAATTTPAPTLGARSLEIKSLKPDSGPADGGTQTLISGSKFGATANVTFDGIAASYIRVVTDILVMATTPPHRVGAVDVALINPDGARCTLPSGFTYTPAKRVPTPTATRPVPTSTPTPTPTQPVKMYTLQIIIMQPGTGSVTLLPEGGIYASGTHVLLTPVPADGYRFVSWGDDLLGPYVPITIVMDTNSKVSAHFVPSGY